MNTPVKNKKQATGFRLLKLVVKLFYGKRKFTGLENFPKEAAIFVGNHAQIHGPITAECFFPDPKTVWCESQVIDKKEFYDYAMVDFWGHKSPKAKWFFSLLTKLITPLFTWLFRSASTVPVYRDMRIRHTFRESIEHLQNGTNIVIFAEKHQPYNRIVNEFQDGFVDLATLYYRRTEKHLCFVPFYNAPSLKTAVIGKPITFDPERPIEEERTRICDYLKNEISALAEGLPVHKVTPYENIKRKYYPKNKISG